VAHPQQDDGLMFVCLHPRVCQRASTVADCYASMDEALEEHSVTHPKICIVIVHALHGRNLAEESSGRHGDRILVR